MNKKPSNIQEHYLKNKNRKSNRKSKKNPQKSDLNN